MVLDVLVGINIGMITLIYKLWFCGVLRETMDPRVIVVVRSVYCSSLKVEKSKLIDCLKRRFHGSELWSYNRRESRGLSPSMV